MKPIQLGCKKCGSVVTVEMKPWTDRLDIKVKDSKLYERSGAIQVLCKKCGKAVAVFGLESL